MKSLTSLIFLAEAIYAVSTGSISSRQTTMPEVTQKGNGERKPPSAWALHSPWLTIPLAAFWADGKRFYIRGVAYQPGGAADAADPLLDITSLTRDIKNFKTLGINTIRVYTVDNSANHDEGMGLLADAGIYLALDVNTPKFSINRADAYQSYNENYLQSVFATVEGFANYTNTLLFFSGNEVINDAATTSVAPYIRSTTRDIKNYINARGFRAIPVGYSSADVSDNIEQQLQYFDCGDESSAVDFFAFNDYSWCDPSDFVTSGWQAKVERYTGYAIPIFMSEFGCIEDTRAWGEVASLYSTNMSSVFSGGIAYEYSYETNGYGIVEIGSDGAITTNQDFDELAAAFAAAKDPSGDGGYNENSTAPACPAQSADWDVPDLLIPAPPSAVEDYMKNGAGTGPGLGSDVTTSHYGGKSYSESNVTMDGVVVASTGNSSGSSSGSSGSGSGSSSGTNSGAASGRMVSIVFAAIPLALGLAFF